MLCLSGHAWWFWAIIFAGKDVENRDWDRWPSHRGPLLIHASKTRSRSEYENAAMGMFEKGLIAGLTKPNPRLDIPSKSIVEVTHGLSTKPYLPPMDELPMGFLIGVVDLCGARQNRIDGHVLRMAEGRLGPGPSCAGCGRTVPFEGACSKPNLWAVPGALGLLVERPRSFEPIPMLGALGLFDVPETVAQREIYVRRAKDKRLAESIAAAGATLEGRGFFADTARVPAPWRLQ